MCLFLFVYLFVLYFSFKSPSLTIFLEMAKFTTIRTLDILILDTSSFDLHYDIGGILLRTNTNYLSYPFVYQVPHAFNGLITLLHLVFVFSKANISINDCLVTGSYMALLTANTISVRNS